MKTILCTVTIIFLLTGCSSTPYVKIGAGYKFQEAEITWTKNGHKEVVNNPISARVELGFENESWSYGVSHHSQYFQGAPFNSKGEYSKTEVFIDYKYTFGY